MSELKIYGRNDPNFDGCNFCGEPINVCLLFYELETDRNSASSIAAFIASQRSTKY